MSIRRVLIILSFVGFLVSVFLIYQYSRPEPTFCVTGSNSCDLVRNSPYSVVFGIDLPYLGAVYFLFLTIYLYLRSMDKYAKAPDYILFGILMFGLFVETAYTYVQLFVIEAICFWCLTIELIVLIMAVLYGLALMGEVGKLKNIDEEM
jgi:uncharacterized membrane protein